MEAAPGSKFKAVYVTATKRLTRYPGHFMLTFIDVYTEACEQKELQRRLEKRFTGVCRRHCRRQEVA